MTSVPLQNNKKPVKLPSKKRERDREKNTAPTKKMKKTHQVLFLTTTTKEKKQQLSLSPLLLLLPRRGVDHPEVVVLHRRHAEDLVRVHPRADDAEAHLGPGRDPRPLVGGDKGRLSSPSARPRTASSSSPSSSSASSAAELVLVRDQVVGHEDLHGPGVGEEPYFRDGRHDGVEDLAPRRPEDEAAVPQREGRGACAAVADRPLADGLDARDADDEAVLAGAGALDLRKFFF